MIVGVGTDICGTDRVDEVLAKHGQRFVARVVAGDSDAHTVWDTAKLARRWALKEAVAKALGTGIGDDCGFADIVVSHTAAGAPQVKLVGHAGINVQVSVSDDGAYAVAFAVAQRV
jgi:holo-[acyl-carrier protein] synthase